MIGKAPPRPRRCGPVHLAPRQLEPARLRLNGVTTRLLGVLLGCLLLGSAGCASGVQRSVSSDAPGTSSPSGASGTSPTGSAPPRSDTSNSPQPTPSAEMPCNPGTGFPVDQEGCPDADPETGWLTATAGDLTLAPFRTLGNDAEGRAYARAHDLDFPFPNDYVDAPDGHPHRLTLTGTTVCTGIIRVGYREPLEDHAVPCRALVKGAADTRIPLPVAVWRDGDVVVQVSELYRP